MRLKWTLKSGKSSEDCKQNKSDWNMMGAKFNVQKMCTAKGANNGYPCDKQSCHLRDRKKSPMRRGERNDNARRV